MSEVKEMLTMYKKFADMVKKMGGVKGLFNVKNQNFQQKSRF